MQLSDIGVALAAVIPNTSRYSAIKKDDQYLVWAEDGQAAAKFADGKMVNQALTGTVDYFTRMPDDPKVKAIQGALNRLSLSWRLESVQYEEETRYIHHEWVWEVESEWLV